MKRLIFSSLGSNYSLQQILLHFLQLLFPDFTAPARLRVRLAALFRVQDCKLVYKGRDAIEYTLRAYGIGKGDSVLTQAFACYAVEEGIRRAGATPQYVDLGKNTVNLTVKSLERAYEKCDKNHVKALLVEHMLGCPADVIALREWCTHKNILLIEDLAQGFGSVDAQGDLLGLHADAVVLSFGRDKILDAVSGGAALLRTAPKVAVAVTGVVSWHVVVRELLYPALTFLIRGLHHFGIGGIIHWIAKKMQLVWSPTKTIVPMMAAMPKEYAALAENQLLALESQLAHRRELATHYFAVFSTAQSEAENVNRISVLTSEEDIKNGSNLRFVITVPNPQLVIEKVSHAGIHIADRWYRFAVDGGMAGCDTVYENGSCPYAEKRAQTVLTLPTHRGIRAGDARRIAHAIISAVNAESGTS